MNVAMVSEHASPLAALGGADAGGQNVHVAALALALGRLGDEVTVYTRRDDPSLPRWVPFGPRARVEHVDAGPPVPLPKDELLPLMDPFAQHLARVWARSRPDVVHAHFWMSGKASLAAASRLGVPVVQTFHALGTVKQRHQGAADTSPPQRVDIERDIVARANGVIATCSDEVDELRWMDADPERIRVVPCGVDLESFRPDGPIAPRPANVLRVLVVTRLVRRKGVDDVIRAVARLQNTELVVAGGPERSALADDPEACRLMELARSLGVLPRVRLMGRVPHDDVPALLRSADVVACCPWYEPFGIVPIEAMACGVPVVGSAVGGLLDTVVDGITGRHVPPRDPESVTRALEELLEDTVLRARLGAGAAVRAHLAYGWDRVARLTRSAYRSLSGGAQPRRRRLAPVEQRTEPARSELPAPLEP